MRKGRFDKKEMAFIKENHKTLPIDEISRKLNRDPESVQKYINQKLGKNASVDDVRVAQAEYDLKNRLYWKDLTQQFSPEELEMILFHWGRMISQFRDDVLPTEELQVLDAIKIEILMGRCLKEQDGGEHVFHLFVVRLAERDRVRQALYDIGVETGVHYPLPLHIQPCCAHLGYSEGEFPVAEKLASEILSLPMFPELLPGQVDEVVDGLRSLV